MKKYLTVGSYILISILFGIFLGNSVLNPTRVVDLQNHLAGASRPQIPYSQQMTMMDEMGANPESTRSIRESYHQSPYSISENPGHNEVRVNLPTFFRLSTHQQTEFSEKLAALKEYTLDINIFTYSQFDLVSIERFYNSLQPSFTSVTWRFYDIPSNYYELFRYFHYNLAHKSIIVELYGKMLPDGFTMHVLVENVATMLRNTLDKNDTLSSLVFNSKELGDVYFMFPMSESGILTLQTLPTQFLQTDRILIETRPSGPGETLRGKEKIEKFFRQSTIPDMYISGVGKKDGSGIVLDGF